MKQNTRARVRPLMRCLMTGGAGLLATANANAQVTKVGDGYLFRVKYAKGKTTHYQMTTKTTLPPGAAGPSSTKPMTMSMIAPISMTVVSVQGNKATIKSDIGAMTMNGQAMSKPQTTEMTIDDRGQIVGKVQGAAAGMGMENMSGTLPEKPLKVGQSFTANKTMAQLNQNIQMKATSTFMGIKTVGGKQLAEMALKISGTGTATMSGTGTSYYNLADGSLNNMTMISSMTMAIPGQPQKMNMKVSVEMKTVDK